MILESGGRFCVGAFGRNLVSVAVKMSSHLNYFIQTFYRCTFNAICKDILAISFIILQHKTNSFPSTLMGHTTLVLMTNDSGNKHVDAMAQADSKCNDFNSRSTEPAEEHQQRQRLF
jgi:hypothetical protein